MKGEELFKNMSLLDDELIQSAAITKKNSKKKLFIITTVILISAFAVITPVAIDLHAQRAEQKKAEKEAARIQYLLEKENNKDETADLSKVKTTVDLDAIKQADEMYREAQRALENMKNPKEIIFENERIKQFKQLEQISLSDLDLSNVDSVEVCRIGSGKTTVFTDLKTIEKVSSVVKGIYSESLDSSGKDYERYWLKMTSNGETVFGLFHDENGYFQCSCFVNYSVDDGLNVGYTVYRYTDEKLLNTVNELFDELLK